MPDERSNATFLMPDYDEYGIAYKDRSALFTYPDGPIKVPELNDRGNNFAFNRMIVIDGRISGAWKPVLKNKKVEVETVFFFKLNKLQAQLVNSEIKRYQAFNAPSSL